MTQSRSMSKNPTYAELLREVKGMQTIQLTHSKLFEKMDNRVGILEDAKKTEDIAKSAIDKYKQEEAQKRHDNLESQERKSKIQVFKDLAPLIVALTALVWAIIQGLPK